MKKLKLRNIGSIFFALICINVIACQWSQQKAAIEKTASYTFYDNKFEKNRGLGITLIYNKNGDLIFSIIREPSCGVETVNYLYANNVVDKITFILSGKKYTYKISQHIKNNLNIECCLLESGTAKPQILHCSADKLEKIYNLTKEKKIHFTWNKLKNSLIHSEVVYCCCSPVVVLL